MIKSDLIAFVNDVSENGVSYAHGKGFEWFKNKLIPYIKEAEQKTPNYNPKIADCWYIVGDIYDFNNAPSKAIESYLKAIELDSSIASAYREIGNMQEQIGEYSNAIQSIEKAIELEPTDENTIADLKNIQKSLEENDEPLYKKDDENWKISELLANENFEKVVEKTNNSNQVIELKYLARAYGGLGLDDNYIETWRKIEALDSDIEIEHADWFYMTDKTYESEHIWNIFKQLNSRIKSSIFIQSDSLNKNYSDLTDSKKRELMCDYQIYDNTNNQNELKKLSLQYPKWIEVSSVK